MDLCAVALVRYFSHNRITKNDLAILLLSLSRLYGVASICFGV